MQRRMFLMNAVTLAIGAALLLGACVAMYFAGRVNFLTLVFFGAAVLVSLSLRESWRIYSEPAPAIVSYSGPLSPFPNTPVHRGGFVALGDKRVYLSRRQIREVQFGRSYEMFLVHPYNTVLSAQPLD
ncbi:MAG: hypothetical protein JNM66_11380 [Bryobacterales bacterium]|nr:hypothetical protein [Bryobacterales bacterium]